ncbi:MAG: hypothetical protein E4H27_08140 [Anaerolineales bacterium]|nr:MAG: hypothetical protein E4H27_08140 [Anaerolineales bacterium]
MANMLNEKVVCNLDSILLRMMDKVKQSGFNGAMAAAHMDENQEIISLTRIHGKLITEENNYYAIAHAKLGEMFDTFKNSGMEGRVKLRGELGYIGGVVKLSGGTHYFAAFTGASGDEDVMVAQYGMEIIP